ncbi:MAG: hypothetical protein R6W89_10450 [Candidatus Hydrogenedentota bacterium]
MRKGEWRLVRLGQPGGEVSLELENLAEDALDSEISQGQMLQPRLV